ncbi:MAG TPA: GNAT family N-acetyltransferase [Nitrospira sp.]|nr:GNAT family N-acetyltransferase [Nitrospira sp.]MCW5795220.1 GNAT family N-acetyltransferase [Nitrospira sp.]HMU30206.1 GNAT family N-acetyltransferase [Nitrospira sp.]HMV56516.1 GNAT family N-acetyltransferase [Nitrospira sp.]HMW85283.1 GNAT family N-acetyltransferase [Nitrospira sp.]
MTAIVTIGTKRLRLRPFQTTDAEAVHRLAGSQDVAAGTFLPHPMDRQAAQDWVTERLKDQAAGTGVTFAITLLENGELIGSIGMELMLVHEQGRLTYWLGRDYWNQGYGTEAVTALVEYGFNSLSLHRIYAPHFHTNPASGRVLQKVGMTYEGRLREHYLRFGQRIDVELYGMIRNEFLGLKVGEKGVADDHG